MTPAWTLLLQPLCPLSVPPLSLSLGFLPRCLSPGPQVCFITNTYLNVFNSWILFYMSHIFYFVVPWDQCPLQRNSSNFGEEREVENEGPWEEEERARRGMKRKTGGRQEMGGCAPSRPVQSHVPPDPECERATSYAYFWYRQALKASDRIEDGGQPSFSLGMFLFLACCLLCTLMVNGIKSIAKVSCTRPLAFLLTSFLPPGQLSPKASCLVDKIPSPRPAP